MTDRKGCQLRNLINGNCLPIGGFCMAVADEICQGLRMAYEHGKHDSIQATGGWISVKDHLPKEHPSIFAPFYGTDRWNSAMWRNESDRVLVTIRFPDGTRTVDKGKLQNGIWKTGVSPVLPQEVTHWAVWPEPPKEEE